MAEVKALVAKADEMEKEIDELNTWLTAPGRPGMRGGLTEKVRVAADGGRRLSARPASSIAQRDALRLTPVRLGRIPAERCSAGHLHPRGTQ